LANSPDIHVPLFGSLRVWQAAFLVVGLPGLLVSLLMMTVPEPKRRHADAQMPSIREVGRFLIGNGNVYGPLIGGIGLGTILAFGVGAWGPTFYIRTFGWTPGQVGLVQGLSWLVLAPIGAMIGSGWAERMARAGRDDANLRVTIYGLLIAMPFFVLFPLMPTGWLAALMNATGLFATALVLGPENAAIQVVTPNRMRGQITAVMLFAFNIIGVGLGPVVIALFTDHLFHNEAQLGLAIFTASAILSPLAVISLALGLKPYARAVAAARQR